MNNTWIDTTNRSRGDKNRIADSWKYKTSQLEIMILSKHIYNPNSWTMHCKEMGFDTYRLRMDLDTPIEQVQQKAFNLVKNKLELLLASLNG